MKKIVILVVCFFISMGVINAETKTVISRNINNIYSRRFINGRLSTIQAAILFLNDGVAYSIDPNLSLTNTTYTVSSNFESVGIDEDKLHYLELLSYFGYPHYCGSDECYIATQEIIWEYLTTGDYHWINAYGAYIDVEYFKDKILNNIENYQKTPNISLYKETYKGEDIILEDNNNVLKYYESNSELGTISDNNLTLSAENPGIYTITLKRKPLHNSNYSSHVYFSDNSQTLVTLGYTNNSKYIDTFEVTYKVKTKSKIKVAVKDILTSEIIENKQTKIKIYDVNNNCYIKENDSEIITIDESGIYQSGVSFDSGKYIVEEIESPVGYQKTNSPVTFNIDEYNESNIEVVIYNEKLEIDDLEEDSVTKDETPSEEDALKNPEIPDDQDKEDGIINSETQDKEETEVSKEEQDDIKDSDILGEENEESLPEIDNIENKDNLGEMKDSVEEILPENSKELEEIEKEEDIMKEQESIDLENKSQGENENITEDTSENNSSDSDNKDKVVEENNKNETNNIVFDKEEIKMTIDSVETVIKNPNTYRKENSKITVLFLLILLMYLYRLKRLNLHL